MTILPLTGSCVEPQDEDMTTDLLRGSAPHDDRWRDTLLARLRAWSLDHRLAAGYPPGFSRALAVRARQIVSPAERRGLAQDWEHVLDLAARPPVPRTPRGPLRRDRIAAAEREVREMLSVLTGPLPIAARGAAMAMLLLSDGTGPLHNHRSALDLTAAVREATRQMDPLAGPWDGTKP
jgi:hypothetical protein